MDVAEKSVVTPAHLAADAGSVSCLQTLIQYGFNINVTTSSRKAEGTYGVDGFGPGHFCYEEKSTPLHLAARGGHLRCVRLLLNHGANINALDMKEQTPLYLAAKGGHAKCVMILLQIAGDRPNVCTPTLFQDTALLKCFQHGEKMRHCIKELVRRGADVSRHNSRGKSAVHEALCHGWDMDMIKLLIVKGHGMDFDRTHLKSPSQLLMDFRLPYERDVAGPYPPLSVYENNSAAVLFLRMGATRRELKKLLFQELQLSRRPGVLLETLMDSFAYLPPLSEMAGECVAPPEDPTDQVRKQTEDQLAEIVMEKQKQYRQRCSEVPSLAHLSRAAIRSSLQADVRQVISWPVPQSVKRYILLGYDL